MRNRERVDTFRIQVYPIGLVCISDNSQLTRQELPKLISFAFHYGRYVLWRRSSSTCEDTYAFASKDGDWITFECDLEWLRNALNRLEPGWTIENGILFSPEVSNLDIEAIEDAIKSAIGVTD